MTNDNDQHFFVHVQYRTFLLEHVTPPTVRVHADRLWQRILLLHA